MDWLWSALHLDDGTHVHGVNLTIPGVPPIFGGLKGMIEGMYKEIK